LEGYIADNSGNDLLISATNAIEISKWSLVQLIDDKNKLMALILVFSLILVGILLFLLLWFILKLYNQSHRFSNILFTIPLDEAEETESVIGNLLQIVKKKYE